MTFAYYEPLGKPNVRIAPDDMIGAWSHTTNMAKRKRSKSEYETMHRKSGWYAAAWRDFRGLSQQDMADALNTSKGQISDLESGAERTRYNRDWLEGYCRVLEVAAGDLLETNPFEADPLFTSLKKAFPTLDDTDRAAVVSLAETLNKRRA